MEVEVEKPGRQPTDFTALTILSILVSLPVAFVWRMSPLGFGFSDMPANPDLRSFALATYRLSHAVGIPFLLIAQAAGSLLLVLGRSKDAFRTSAIALLLFVFLAVLAAALLSA